MNRTLTATQARKQFFQVLEVAGKPGATVTITLEGHPPVVLLSQEEFEGWQETLEIISDPDLMKDIRAGMKDMKMVTLESVEKRLRLK